MANTKKSGASKKTTSRAQTKTKSSSKVKPKITTKLKKSIAAKNTKQSKPKEKTKSLDSKAFWIMTLLRIVTGLFFLFAGLPKLIALFQGVNPLSGMGIPLL